MKRRLIIITTLVGIGTIGALASASLRNSNKGIKASGTLEARNVSVGSKVGGRVAQVLVQEGDRVKPGQLLVTFDSAELNARVIQARGRYELAKANLEKALHGSRPEEIVEANAAGGSNGYREQELEQSRSTLASARAELTNVEVNFGRMQNLAAAGVVSRQVLDDAEARLRVAQATVQNAEHGVSAADGRLRAAKATQQKTERGTRVEDIAAARAELVQAEGELAEAEARFAEREVRSPAAATVEVLDIRPGDLVAENAPLAKLLEANELYVTVYVPQAVVSRAVVGQAATARVDGIDHTFAARVEQIRQRAEFLPKNVQTDDERSHQVIGIKLRVDNATNELRSGVHAVVIFAEEPK